MTPSTTDLVHELGPVALPNWNRYAAVNEEFVLIHMDDDVARRAGFDQAFAMGNLVWSYVHRACRAWFDDGQVERVRLRFLAPAYRGDMIVRARAVGEHHFEVHVHVDGTITAAGDIFVR